MSRLRGSNSFQKSGNLEIGKIRYWEPSYLTNQELTKFEGRISARTTVASRTPLSQR